MKNNKKTLQLIVLILILTTFMIGCSSNKEKQPSSSTQTTTEGESLDALSYLVYKDHVEIISLKKQDAQEINIPATIENLPVTHIGDYAFQGCVSLSNIAIPDSVTIIGGSAFENCTSLSDITLPDNIASIGDLAFEETPWLEQQLTQLKDNDLVIVNNIVLSAKKQQRIS